MKSFNCFIAEKVDKKFKDPIKQLINDVKALNQKDTGVDQSMVDRTVKMLEKMLKESTEQIKVINIMISEGKSTEDIIKVLDIFSKKEE